MRIAQVPLASLVAATALLAGGCASPFGRESADDALRRRVAGAIERELATVPEEGAVLETTQPPPIEVQEPQLAERRGELRAIGPDVPFPAGKLDMGPDLAGRPQREVTLSLQSAIATAVRHNLGIQTARLQPAINEADVVAAEAAFDAVFFANATLQRTDQPATVPVIAGRLIGVGVSGSDQYLFETGVRQTLTSGGEVFVSTDLTRFNNRAPLISFSPDPAYTAAVRLGITQPLLRGFGSSVNTATIRLARNTERRSIEQLRSELLALLDETEEAYWNLVFAWQNLAIQEWLLRTGIEVRDVMERRRDFDTKLAEYSDAVATVEARKANVIAARREIRRASDALKVLINDPQLTVGSEALLVPADLMVETAIRYDLRDAVLAAVANRPEIQQSVLGIDDAAIRQMLADNARLPLLNLSAEAGYFGLADSPGDSYGNVTEGSFLDWLFGLAFEWPIGNRAAEAGYRQARLARSAAVIDYQEAIQAVVFDVKDALRDCITNYELIQATRSSRIAAAENLRALLVEEETLAGLTPEFLNLKFQRQERLAVAQEQETRALVEYNQSVATLYRAMGISLAMNRIEIEIIGEEDEDSLAAGGPGHAPSGPGS